MKRTLWDAETHHEKIHAEMQDAFNRTITTYHECLGFEPDNPTARADMAELYWRLFAEFEDRDDRREQALTEFYRAQVGFFQDGRYSAALKGDGSLRLDTTPVPARVRLGRFEEIDRALRVVDERDLGLTPVEVSPLAMGSYFLTLEAEGFRPARVPVFIRRQSRVDSVVRLFPHHHLTDYFVQVPAGEFIKGDPLVFSGGARERDRLGDFFIGKFPVTVAEYLEFLNDLHRSDPEQAKRRQPRAAPSSGYYWKLDESTNEYRLPRDAEIEKFAWLPTWPVIGVSWEDGIAYSQWISGRWNFTVTLPTALQREKAGRGVDGRRFPWGNRVESTFSNNTQARKEGPKLLPCGSYPTDRSVYGAFDMSGNVADWCLDDVGEKYPGWKNIRGGYWTQTAPNLALATQRAYNLDGVFFFIGFRLCVNA